MSLTIQNRRTRQNRSYAYIYTYILIAICIIFFALKLASINHALSWDESVYIGMGKYIYSAGTSGLCEMIRPLGLPAITGSFWGIGLDQIIASKIFSILVSIGCIIVTFFIGRELFDGKHAIIGALLLAVTPVFFFYADSILTDNISTLLLMLALLMLIKGKFIPAGISAGLAFWFKFTHILFILAIILFLAYKIFALKNRKDIGRYVLTASIMIIFVAAYFFSNYLLYSGHLGPMDAMLRPYMDASAYSHNPYLSSGFHDVKSFSYYTAYYIYGILFNTTYGFLMYLFFLIYIYKFITTRNIFRNERHTLIMTIFLVYLAYFSIIPFKTERFFVFFLPIMAVYAAYGFIKVWNMDTKTKNAATIFRIIAEIFIIAALIISISSISSSYRWNESDGKPDYAIERYFDVHGIHGPILTNNPRFTAYSDERYVGAYDILNKNGLFVNDWESEMNFTAVVYMNNSVSCMDTDAKCASNAKKLREWINTDFKELDSYIYNGANVTFYTRR